MASKRNAPMDPALRKRVEDNLFPAARPAVEPWDQFKWHPNAEECQTEARHSSQALAIDFFGTLKAAPQAERDSILGKLCERLQLPPQGPWQIHLEWEDRKNSLNETRRTQVDAFAEGKSARILFECKFTEPDGGACSQTEPSDRQCNGNYEMQVNPHKPEAGRHRCALTAKGIRYWEVIPSVFQYEADRDHSPCPFAGPWYQWMRNLVLAQEIRRVTDLPTRFVIVYARHPKLPVSGMLTGDNAKTSPNWNAFQSKLRPGSDLLHTISFQELLKIADGAAETDGAKWLELQAWVAGKIRDVGEAPPATRRQAMPLAE